MPDYQNSILNVSASILNHYGVTTAYSTLKILDQELKKDYKHVILMVLDGMGINILNHNLSSDSLLRKNIKTTLVGLSANDYSFDHGNIVRVATDSSGHLGWTNIIKSMILSQPFFNTITITRIKY